MASPQPEPDRIAQAAALLHAEADDLHRAFMFFYARMVQDGNITQLCRMQARAQMVRHLANQVQNLSLSPIPDHD